MARVKKAAGSPDIEHRSPVQVMVATDKTAESIVDEISAELAKVMDLSVGKRAVVFENANAAEYRPIDPRFEPMVQRTFEPKDWMKTLDRYEAWLSMGDRRTEEAFIRRAHEQGPEILQSLHDAYIQVRYARETWEQENEVVFGGMREEATKALQHEKDRGFRNKTITEKDVESRCAAMFPDEYARQEALRRRHKAVEDRSKACIEVAGVRCRVLDSMMARLR